MMDRIPFGGSQRTATGLVSLSMSVTIPVTDMQMGGSEANSSGPAKASYCEPMLPMHSLFGETLSTTAGKTASTAPSSATKVRSSRRSLSDKLTRSLITSGLVAGITPMSVRKTFGLAIRDFASLPLDGSTAAAPEVDSVYLSGCRLDAPSAGVTAPSEGE